MSFGYGHKDKVTSFIFKIPDSNKEDLIKYCNQIYPSLLIDSLIFNIIFSNYLFSSFFQNYRDLSIHLETNFGSTHLFIPLAIMWNDNDMLIQIKTK